ncbi:hypothetical protein E4T56_gene10609 [Termitomyces sp. T112]|nr:hypothetical protein E4T56_gene10609 [Termitomyces sp. T112]
MHHVNLILLPRCLDAFFDGALGVACCCPATRFVSSARFSSPTTISNSIVQCVHLETRNQQSSLPHPLRSES